VSTGSASLPANHPSITLPDDVKGRIDELAAKTEVAPQDINAWKTLAQVQFRASQFDPKYRSAALTSYQHVLELAPQDPEALRGAGNVYYDLEEHTKAIEHYQKYLALRPEDPSVRTDLGTMYLYSGDPSKAIVEYQAVVAENPTFFQAYFNLGIAYGEQGNKEKAAQALTRARELTTNQEIRQRVDQVLAQIAPGVHPASAPTSEGAGLSAGPSAGLPAGLPAGLSAGLSANLSPFQRAVEELFRSHEIMGPRVSRIEWSSPTQGKAYLRDFPMSGMPPEVRERFVGRLRTKINEAKVLHSIDSELRLEMVDMATGQVMETISS
jgi:tetratricopeptide (TPR) repeat protein